MHYKLLENDTIEINGIKLYRIEATEDTQYAKKGKKGGYIEKYENLQGNAWVGDDAKVFDDAKVIENALVLGNAIIKHNAVVCDGAKVFGNATVYNSSMICGDATVYGGALIGGYAKIYQNARIYGLAKVYDKASVYGNCILCGDASVGGYTMIYNNITLKFERIHGESKISNYSDYISIKGLGNAYRTTTISRGINNLVVTCGCFVGDLDEFYQIVSERYRDENKFHFNQYISFIKTAEVHFGVKVKRPFLWKLINKY